MSQNHDEDLPVGAGTQSGVSHKWISIFMDDRDSDRTKMRVGKEGLPFDTLVGKLVGAEKPVWKEASGKIPAHYEYTLVIRARDTNGDPQTFKLSLHGHWSSPIMSDILNPFLWMVKQPGHNRLFRLVTYSKKTDNNMSVMRAVVYDGNNPNTKDFMPAKFPWVGDKTNGKFEGVPEPGTGPDGKKDFSTIQKFWADQWMELVAAFAGQPQPATTTTQQKTPAPTPPRDDSNMFVAPMATEGMAPQVAGAITWFNTKWAAAPAKDEATFILLSKTLMAMCKDPKRPTPFTQTELDTVVKALNTYAQQNLLTFPVGEVIGPDGTLIQDPSSGISPNADAPTSAGADDLPF